MTPSLRAAVLFVFLSLPIAKATETESEYTAQFNRTVAAITAKYPDLADEKSPMSTLLEFRVLRAKKDLDPALDDPRFLAAFADDLAREMKELGMPVADVVAAEPPAQAPAVEARNSNDHYTVEQAMADAMEGKAGMDPVLQTAARSGDANARLEIERRQAHQRINLRLEAGEISAETAAAEQAAADAAKAAGMKRSQVEELMERQQRLEWQRQTDIERQKREDRKRGLR